MLKGSGGPFELLAAHTSTTNEPARIRHRRRAPALGKDPDPARAQNRPHQPPHAAPPPSDMQFLLLVYTDAELIGHLPPAQYDEHMRHCLAKADALKSEGRVLDFQQLEPPQAARSVRVRAG